MTSTASQQDRRLRDVLPTDEEVDYWLHKKREWAASGEEVPTVDDLHEFTLDEPEKWGVVEHADGCTISWVAPGQGPGATFARHCVLDDQVVYALVFEPDEAIAALRRDPRVSVVFDEWIGESAVSIRGKVDFVDDLATLVRVLIAEGRKAGIDEEALARRIAAADPSRLRVLRVVPDRWITFTHRKIYGFSSNPGYKPGRTDIANDNHRVTELEVDGWVARKKAQAPSGFTAIEVTEDDETAWNVMGQCRDATIAWRTKDGGVSSAHVGVSILDGQIVSTTTKGRAKTYALQRNANSAMVYVANDRRSSTTVYGRAELSDDERYVTWFTLGFMRFRAPLDAPVNPSAGRGFRGFDTPNRYVVRFHPARFVTRTRREP